MTISCFSKREGRCVKRVRERKSVKDDASIFVKVKDDASNILFGEEKIGYGIVCAQIVKKGMCGCLVKYRHEWSPSIFTV